MSTLKKTLKFTLNRPLLSLLSGNIGDVHSSRDLVGLQNMEEYVILIHLPTARIT